MHQMCLSKTGTTVDKQRIVGISWRFGYSKSCCLGKFIVTSDYKSVESVFRSGRPETVLSEKLDLFLVHLQVK